VNLPHDIDDDDVHYKHEYRHVIALLCWEHSKSQELIRAIESFGETGCGDPRDRVYALMGIVGRRQRLVVDYRTTVCDVYIGVVMRSLRRRVRIFWRKKNLVNTKQINGFSKGPANWSGGTFRCHLRAEIGSITCVVYQPAKESGKTLDRWWYEDATGVRHFCECQNPPEEPHDRLRRQQIPYQVPEWLDLPDPIFP
jgi:hypothetical protein